MVKLVDTRDLKSLGIIYRAGSTPALGTKEKAGPNDPASEYGGSICG